MSVCQLIMLLPKNYNLKKKTIPSALRVKEDGLPLSFPLDSIIGWGLPEIHKLNHIDGRSEISLLSAEDNFKLGVKMMYCCSSFQEIGLQEWEKLDRYSAKKKKTQKKQRTSIMIILQECHPPSNNAIEAPTEWLIFCRWYFQMDFF